LRKQVEIGAHHLKGDETGRVGGTDTGPTPYDLLLAALGTCTSIDYLVLCPGEKVGHSDNVTVSLHHSKIHATDCADCETKEGKIDRIERRLS